MRLEEIFEPFFGKLFPKRGFTRVPGSKVEGNLGVSEAFENDDFRVRLTLDRLIPIVDLAPIDSEGWLLAVRLLCFLRPGSSEILQPKALADWIDADYQLIREFFERTGYVERERKYRTFALESVASRHPDWRIERTDRWKDLHGE